MYELTEEWLREVNEEFRRNDVPHKQRPWLAWMEWAKHSGMSPTLGDEVVKEIFAWFEKNTRAGSQHIGPMYTGAFYYDSCFWPVVIPVIAGTVRLNALDSLKTMPDPIKASLSADMEGVNLYLALWADCADYAFGIESLTEGRKASGFGQELFRSSDQQLSAAVSLLLENRPNSKAVESARMATEMFLKAFLAAKAGLTEADARSKIGHNLEKALDRCLAVDASSELKNIRSELSCFPEVGERYKGAEKLPRELWRAYDLSQFVGATVVRMLTGHDVRPSFKVS